MTSQNGSEVCCVAEGEGLPDEQGGNKETTDACHLVLGGECVLHRSPTMMSECRAHWYSLLSTLATKGGCGGRCSGCTCKNKKGRGDNC